MKKHFILAVAAVAAMAACTKTEVNAPDHAISFQVANYVPQTKTGEVAYDGTQFNTYAWFNPESGDAQVFMNNETIKWQSVSNSWASDRAYFWPKTGDVNFFSYAGTPVPAVTNGSATYTDKTIAITDNALLASAAYHYGATNWNTNVYSGITYGTDTDVTGVPTLFHHILAQVSFIVKFAATGITDTNYKWDLTVNSASIEYANVGTLTVTFTDPNTTGQAWPFTTAGYNWVPKANTANTELEAPAGTGAVEFDGTANKQTVTANATGDAVSDGIYIIKEVSVMPQNIVPTTGSNAVLNINYTLKSYYDDAEHITETVDLTDLVLSQKFTSNAITAWNMNYKYTYTITIQPNKTVTFDPAVEAWATDAAGYTYPED